MKDSAEMEAQRKREAREAKERHDMIYPSGTDQEAQLRDQLTTGMEVKIPAVKKRKSPKP